MVISSQTNWLETEASLLFEAQSRSELLSEALGGAHNEVVANC